MMTHNGDYGISFKRIVLAGAAGAIASGLFWLALPGESLSAISHGLLHLPGPGSAVAVIYGPFIVLACLLARNLLRCDWAVSVAGAAFALLHGACTPLVLGEVKTAGTVGPWALRILAVLLAVAVLQALLLALKKRSAVLSHVVAAAAANLALMGSYWAAVYPAAGGKTVKAMTVVILAGAGTISAMIFGGLIPALFARCGQRKAGTQ